MWSASIPRFQFFMLIRLLISLIQKVLLSFVELFNPKVLLFFSTIRWACVGSLRQKVSVSQNMNASQKMEINST